MKIVLVTGGFDPLHSGHIEYFKEAKKLGDKLIVAVNSDKWLERKKGKSFMSFAERASVIRALTGVDFVIDFNDDDDTAKHAIEMVRMSYPRNTIIFANGGDRVDTNIPEMDIKDSNVKFVFGIGGFNKANSSSWLLQEWKAPKTIRSWGYYRVLHEVDGLKVKELTIDPKCSLSMQKHQHRSERWVVSEGSCLVNSMLQNGYALPSVKLEKHDTHYIEADEWHQIVNPFDVPCRIVETQYGERCEEDDITRK